MRTEQAGAFPEQHGTTVAGPGPTKEDELGTRIEGMWAT